MAISNDKLPHYIVNENSLELMLKSVPETFFYVLLLAGHLSQKFWLSVLDNLNLRKLKINVIITFVTAETWSDKLCI